MKGNSVYRKTMAWCAMAMLILLCSVGTMAGEVERKIIDKAVSAYGGEKLLNLKHITYRDNIKHFFQMQSGYSSQGAMTQHLSNQQIDVYIDFKNEQKVLDQHTTRLIGNHDAENKTRTHRLFIQGKGYTADHCLKNYTERHRVNFSNADLGFSRLLDPLIVRQLVRQRMYARLVDKAYIQGRPQHVLEVNDSKQAAYTVFIDQQTGYVSRLLKKHGQQLRSYDFFEHQRKGGIVWAKNMFVSTANQVVYYTDSRGLDFDPPQARMFALPKAYSPASTDTFYDVSQMTIRELASGVYFVGKGWGYTLFTDVGEYLISAGAWGEANNSLAWQQSLALFRATTGNKKPVKQHLVTHHHTDHMSSLKDIVAQGADLLAHPTSIDGIKKHFPDLPSDRIVKVENQTILAGGKVRLLDVPNSHADHNLVMYLPAQQILFSEDMFGSSYNTAFHSPNNWPSLDTYSRLKTLVSKISKLGLPVKHYVSSHHGRILGQSDIAQALAMQCG
ncbi:hypothetical protein J8L98_06145 [Pseudoalteromonas sp. MMG013]|uniref:MBL fold metallo-hydrolase n=1 Tax=Pseudoalteromonas sp. MMG013 TaxID=2822687 RepID=UPI001B36805A|nr:MBL fold metallo-hydrolase [Pseudoalteromonas sp. MMG013]MBQ4861269.1 hypothetical protein [Pseudoalteromonas sp. MMG013]